MVTGRFKIGGKSVECTLPEKTNEWTLAKYIDFMVIARRIADGDENIFLAMSNAVQVVTGVDINNIMLSQTGEDYTPGKNEYEGLAAIFGYLKDSAMSRKGRMITDQEIRVDYGGKTFIMPQIKLVALASGIVPKGISVFEAVECLEIIRLTTDKTKKDGDPNGDLWYSQYLKMLALLLHEEGQEFIFDQTIRERQIAQTEVFLKDIDLETALNVDFFLLTILTRSGRTTAIAGSLNRAAFSLTVATTKWNARLMKLVRNLAKSPSKK